MDGLWGTKLIPDVNCGGLAAKWFKGRLDRIKDLTLKDMTVRQRAALMTPFKGFLRGVGMSDKAPGGGNSTPAAPKLSRRAVWMRLGLRSPDFARCWARVESVVQGPIPAQPRAGSQTRCYTPGRLPGGRLKEGNSH